MYVNSDTNFPRVGVVTINGKRYPAEQQAPDHNFRKRATRFYDQGKWCLDDHDLFTPSPINGGRWQPFRLPPGAMFPTPMQFNTWKEGGDFIDGIHKDLDNKKCILYAGMRGVDPLPWFPVGKSGGDGEWTRLSLVKCHEYRNEAPPESGAEPVYLMHIHFAPGSLATDHPHIVTPVHKFCTVPG
jgi:hypothetical protein